MLGALKFGVVQNTARSSRAVQLQYSLKYNFGGARCYSTLDFSLGANKSISADHTPVYSSTRKYRAQP
jgi:hypothetical protein